MTLSLPAIAPAALDAPDEAYVPAATAEYEVLPASFAQERLWLVQQLEGAGAAYHLFRAFRVEGPLSAPALERAFAEVVRRHEALRTTFREDDGAPVQVVAAFRGFTVPVADLSGAGGEEEVARRLGEEAARPFDLRTGPLFRAGLLRRGADVHVLWIAMHHIVSDGWSMDLLYRELAALYGAYAGGEDARLPDLPVQYADFAVWQRDQLRGEALERHLAYWRERLAGAPALLELPADRPRPAAQRYRGATERFTLRGGVRERLEALARQEGATPFMVLLAAFQVLLAKYAGVVDVVVGTPVAGRTRREVEGLIGFFANMLVLRTDLSGDPPFREVVRRVRAAAAAAYEHQELPFEMLVAELRPERALSHAPLFQVVFAMEGAAPPAGAWPGLRLWPLETERGTAKFDLVLTLSAVEGGLGGAWSYATDLFDRGTIRRMSAHLARVMEQAADDPGLPLSRLALMDAAERRQVLEEWNRTGAPDPAECCIHELFEAQARVTPHAAAVVFQDETVTYRELDERADRLAHRLRARGVGPEVRVGVCLDRTVELVAGLLGVLKAGGAYVPLDPAYPDERLAYMVADAGVAVLLTCEDLAARVAVPADVRVVLADGRGEDPPVRSARDPRSAAGPANLAYVIYTSGSTGRPKGVQIEHRATVALLRWAADAFTADDLAGVLASTSICFDVSIAELFLPLCVGGAVVMARDALALAELPRRDAVTLVSTVPSAAAELARAGAIPPSVRTVNLGGEPVPRALADALYSTGTVLRVHNGYGPSEDTTYSTWSLVENGPALVTIGRPVTGTQAYVLDAWMQPVPAGIPGELYLGGAGLSRGYLGQPGLTAERYVPDPFGGRPGARMYRTGDRTRWTAAGVLEYFGRLDHQVKIRGFRVEPGEVEAALLRHPRVRECAVVVREDGPGERRLVAYVAGGADADALRAHLRGSLPDYMVPSAFVALDALPLTPNGKLDRRALPAPVGTADEGRAAPRTPVEEVLAGVFAELLRVERVGVHDSFFDLGGHSLLGTRVVSRVRDLLSAELPLRAVFEAPTVAELAARVEEVRRAGRAPLPPVVPVERTASPPLSFAQERLWFLDRLEPGSALYNVPAALRLRGEVDARALERALGELVRRHEALRTTFTAAGGAPVQVIAPFTGFALPVEEVPGLGEAEREEEARRRAREDGRRPFDLAAGPLFRARLLRLAPDDHVLLLAMHHVVTDGWSLGVLHRELSALYAACRAGVEPSLPPLAVQYADYAAWQRTHLRDEVLEGHLAWWRERLAGAPALLELPADHPRPAVQRHRGARAPVAFPAELLERLQALGRREGATLYMVLLGAFQVLLARYAGRDDVVVGTTIAGRTRGETEPLVGLFMNTLALRTDLSGAPPFREVLRRVRETTLGAYEHQEVPFERLVEALRPDRTLSHSPLIQVMLELHEPAAPAALAGVEVRRVEMDPGVAKLDLSLALVPGADGLTGSVTYATDLFEQGTVLRMMAHLGRVLEQVAEDAEGRISRLSLLEPAERARVLEAWNATEAPYPAGACIHELFQAQAARTPDAPAVVFGDDSLTYAELDARANHLAHHLARLGVGPELRVGLCLERSLELMVGILGVLKAGAAYVPVDPGHPPERTAWVLRDAGAAVLLTQAALRARVPVGPGVRTVCVDRCWPEIAADRLAPPATGVRSENLAYVIYTSGSTGRPKGVAMHHRGVANYIHWGIGHYGADRGNGAPVFSSMTVDLTITNLLPLFAGRPVRLLPEGNAVEALAEVLREGPGFGLIKITPVHLSLLTPLLTADQARSAAHTLVIGADSLPAEATVWWQDNAPDVRLMNEYGPTETVVGCSAYTLPNGMHRAGAVPVGGAIQNLTFFVLDAHGEPVPVGMPGELYIGGAGVARGYLGRPGLSAEKFVPDPFAGGGARMYRTGDRARWQADGNLLVLGRTDHQVKIRGYRVEPGEIEAALRRHPGVSAALVVVREDAPGDRRLAAYVVGDAEAEALRAHLRRTLPEYMMPAAFVRLASLPRTGTGKIDPRTLPAPDYALPAERYVAPRTPAEELLAAIWCEVLGVERVGAEDDFFELGGHSLLATRTVSRIREVFGVELPLRALFEAPTPAGLAQAVEALRRAELAALPPVVPVERDGPLPPSFAQERLWFLDRLQPESAFYNVPLALRLRGGLHLPALERALGEVVRRHEALRTVLPRRDGGPVQVVVPFDGLALAVEDLSVLPAESREREARRQVEETAGQPFDLTTGPLFRARLLRLDDGDHVLLLSMHHVVSDGWSVGVLLREAAALYGAYREGRGSPLPELPVQYADYAVWQRAQLRGEALGRQLDWWTERLEGAPALLELPTDHPRPAVQSYRGAYERAELPAGVLEPLRALGRSQGATLYMVLLGAFQVLLARYGGRGDVVVGSPTAGRTRREVEGLVGLFANTLVMRTDLSGDPDFREVLRRVRETALGAYEHQDVPFERLVEALQPERSLSHAPLFQVAFALEEDGGPPPVFAGLRSEPVHAEPETAKVDLTLGLRAGADGLRATLGYAADLWERGTMARMLAHLGRVLRQVADDPGLRLSELSLLTEAERRVVVEGWSGGGGPYQPRPLHHLVAEQAARTPGAPALHFAGRAVTYRELDAAANRLAHHLAARGAGPETVVAVVAERTPDTAVAILAVLKAGAAYLPLDPAYPEARLRYMLADSGARLVVSPGPLPEGLRDAIPSGVVDLRAEAEAIVAWPDHAPAVPADPRHLAYLIYTSGSSGPPKGVAVPHHGVPNEAWWIHARTGLRAGDRVLQFASFSFDAAVHELFGALLAGATLVMAERAALMPGGPLRATLRHERITFATLPPSVLAVMDPADLPELRVVVSAGEALAPGVASRWAGAVELHNAYGPTETTVAASSARVVGGGGRITIGRPLENVRIYVLDDTGRPLPAGVPGEMHVGGAGVARGYHGRPGLTAERFVPDPFGPAGARLYRTGDRVRWSADGELEYLGRLDGQVKLRGFRIEPGEIEAALRGHPDVDDCVVVAREDVPGDRRLAAYVVGEADAESVRSHLRRTLPEHMVPGPVILLPELPLTPNGKVDRRALPAPAAGGERPLAPETELEARLAALWGELLGVESVGVEDNFFDLGGHSLLMVRLQARLAGDLGREVPMVELFQHPTVRALAARLQGRAASGAAEEGEDRGGVRQATLGRRLEAARRRRDA